MGWEVVGVDSRLVPRRRWRIRKMAGFSMLRYMIDANAGLRQREGSRLKRGEYRILRGGEELAFGAETRGGKDGEEHSHGFRTHPCLGYHIYHVLTLLVAGFVYYNMLPGPLVNGIEKHYDFDGELGKGAFATVYRALSREDSQWYAVKVVHIRKLGLSPGWVKDLAKGPPTDPDVRKLLKEVTILERLEHKNICQLKEYYVERDRISTFFLIMGIHVSLVLCRPCHEARRGR